MTYIHELKSWPNFTWSKDQLADLTAKVRHQQGRLLGRMEGLGFDLKNEASLQSLTTEIIKSNEIEGQFLDKESVRSSIARRIGLDVGSMPPASREIEGVVEMMLDATQKYNQPLTDERLFGWHSCLFPTGRSGMTKIKVGEWRDDHNGPMQVVSGHMGREMVHFEAPPAKGLAKEMKAFIQWFNEDSQIDGVVKAAIAHLWFVTIHPLDDGNGRIARALTDLALARSENSAQRFYSMSAQIQREHKGYYQILEATQKGDLDITAWIEWFLNCLGRALEGAQELLAGVLGKAKYWDNFRDESINDRQRDILNRLLDGFEGKLTSSKWAKITKCSQDTATRDINDLIKRGVLKKNPEGGRSTSYSLFIEE